MTILYEPEISTAGHYEPEIPTAGHYEPEIPTGPQNARFQELPPPGPLTALSLIF
jgi:hypothetical protein